MIINEYYITIISLIINYYYQLLLSINTITLSLIITLIGAYGILKIEKTAIQVHCLVTTGVIGSVCIYTLFEAFFIR